MVGRRHGQASPWEGNFILLCWPAARRNGATITCRSALVSGSLGPNALLTPRGRAKRKLSEFRLRLALPRQRGRAKSKMRFLATRNEESSIPNLFFVFRGSAPMIAQIMISRDSNHPRRGGDHVDGLVGHGYA